MGLFIDSIETRSLSGDTTLISNPAGWLWEAFGSEPTDAGISVTPKSSLKCTAVYACVNVIARSIGQVPWDVFRRTGTKKQVARDRTEHYLLHTEPLGTMTSFSFRVAFMVNVLLYGNGYAEILRDGANRVTGLRILPAWTVTVYESLDGMRLVYKVTRLDGTVDDLDASDVIHVPCISLDGVSGLSPISQHRQAVGLALAAETAGAAFFGNGSRPSGFLSSAARLSDKDKTELEERWKKYTGPKNTGKVPIVSGDLKWNQMMIPPSDAQYIETRIFQVSDIARIFGVPAVLIGLADKTSTYASAEAFFQSFAIGPLAQWTQAIEQEFDRKLFPNTDKLFNKLDLKGLMRGDPKTRAEFYKALWSSAAINAETICEWEDLDPPKGGDRYFIQQGFMPLDKVDEVIAQQGSQQKPATTGDPGKKGARAAHTAWLDDVVARVTKWEKRDLAKVAEAFAPVFRSLAAGDPIAFCTQLARDFIPGDITFSQRAIEKFENEVTKLIAQEGGDDERNT